MEQVTPNEPVWPILILLYFASTKLVAQIVLRFICFLACAPIFFELLTLGFQRWDLALDLLSRFIFVIDGGNSAMFILVKGIVLPSAIDVEALPIVKYGLLLSVQ